jgi:hypothetical protein
MITTTIEDVISRELEAVAETDAMIIGMVYEVVDGVEDGKWLRTSRSSRALSTC